MTVGKQTGPEDIEQLRDLGHLASAVSHSVINAFSAVVSNAELIRSHTWDANSDPEELTALGAAIIENALLAAQIPRRLIDWTRRFTAPGFEPGAAPPLIDLNEVVRSVVSAQSAGRGHSITWSLNLGQVPMVRGNAEQLRAMLGHLIENARDAMPGGIGTISFHTRAAARNWVVLEVRDTGKGMSLDVVKHAAEPFFTTKPGRSGTGLTIAHGIWRRHHGTLAIESQPGQGALVRLSVEAPAPPPMAQQGPATGRVALRPAEPAQAEKTPVVPTSATVAGPAANRPVANAAVEGEALDGGAAGQFAFPLEKGPPLEDQRVSKTAGGPAASKVEEGPAQDEPRAAPVLEDA